MKVIISLVLLGVGGAERFATTLANVLSNQKDEVVIVCSYKEPSFNYFIDKGVRICEIFPKELYKSGFKHYFSVLSRMLLVRKLVKKEKPDVIFSFYFKNSTQDIISTLGLNVPIIISERDAFFLNDQRKERVIRKLVYKIAAGFVYQTSFAKNTLEKLNLKCKPNIVLKNPVYITDYPDEIDVCSKDKIVCVGRLDKNKNIIGVIRAFSMIVNKYNDFKLEIYGDGPELENLIKEAQKLNIEKQVSFLGISNDVVKVLAGSRCFILFSNLEGYPNVLLEAMAVGVPVIATDCPVGACHELIKDGQTGFLVPVGDENKLAEKIDFVLSDLEKSKVMAINARYVRETNEKNYIVRTLHEFLEGIKNNSNDKKNKFK